MASSSVILISLPVLRRHQHFYLEIKNKILSEGLEPLFFTTCEVNASYWSQVLEVKVYAPPYRSLSKGKFSKKDWDDLVKKGNDSYSTVVSLKNIYTVQQAQQPQRFRDRTAFDVALNNAYEYLSTLVSEKNVIHAFNTAAALDYDNFIFNWVVASLNIKIIFLSYSPVADYELSFSSKYYSHYLEREPSETIANRVDELINGNQRKDPNSGYIVARQKDKFLTVRRFISHLKLAYLTPGASVGRLIINTFRRWVVNYCPNRIILALIKEDILNQNSKADVIFIGTTKNESFFIASKYFNTYITEICDFAKSNPNLVCVYKPHPATLHQYFMYAELRKLQANGVIISMEPSNFPNWGRLKFIVGLSSSTLIHASLSGIPTYCLEPGLHEYFGVQKLDSFSEISKLVSLDHTEMKVNDVDRAKVSRIFFKGIQRFYNNDAATQAATSVVEAITLSANIDKDEVR